MGSKAGPERMHYDNLIIDSLLNPLFYVIILEDIVSEATYDKP